MEITNSFGMKYLGNEKKDVMLCNWIEMLLKA